MSTYYDPTCVWLRVDWRSGWNIGTVYIMKNNSVVTACFDIGLGISMFVWCVWNACYFILLLCKRCFFVHQKWVKFKTPMPEEFWTAKHVIVHIVLLSQLAIWIQLTLVQSLADCPGRIIKIILEMSSWCWSMTAKKHVIKRENKKVFKIREKSI